MGGRVCGWWVAWSLCCAVFAGKVTVQPPADEEAKILNLRDARVVVADYEALRRDFHRCLWKAGPKDIDRWLIRETAFFRDTQVRRGPKERLHEAVRVGEEERKASVPPMYGRAVVLTIPAGRPCGGMKFDVKGGGTRKPRAGLHANGVLDLAGALFEYWGEKIVARVGTNGSLASTTGHVRTVPTYAVLSAGMRANVTGAGFSWLPSAWSDLALLVRRRQRRHPNYVLPPYETSELEQALQPWGLSFGVPARYYNEGPLAACPEPSRMPADWAVVDAQASETNDIVDFSALLLDVCDTLPTYQVPTQFVSSLPEMRSVSACLDAHTDSLLRDCGKCQRSFAFLTAAGMVSQRESSCRSQSVAAAVLGVEGKVSYRNGFEKIISSGLVSPVDQKRLRTTPLSSNVQLIRDLDAKLATALDAFFLNGTL